VRVERAALQVLLLGMCSGALWWTFYRVFTIKFPLNFISPTYATIPLFGIPLGLVLARRAPALSRRVVTLLGLAIVLFVASTLAFKDKSVHYLLFGAYYDYPAPTSSWVTRGLIASLPLSMVPFLVMTASFVRLPATLHRYTLPALLLGIGCGVLLAEWWGTPKLGAYAILIVAGAGAALFLPVRLVGLATAASVLLTGWIMYHPPEAIFTWQLREYTRLETYWTHHYKLDWIEFGGGHCLGAVKNEIMIGYSCDSPEKLPLTHLRMAEVISNGPIRRERVTSIGRADGVIAAAHKTKNPHVKRFVAVENDERAVHAMLSRYSRYQGDIFTTSPNIELVGGDERLWLERTEEKFDAVYLDGIGLMLEPFPLTVIQQENYLFSFDAYRRIFDDLLTPDGVLIIDRGTTNEGESQDLGASLPDGVQVRTLYTKIPTYPLTGLPLVYVIASRNGAELDRIAGELIKGNLYGRDTYDPIEARKRRSSDDWPMFQPEAIGGMTVVTVPFALVTLVLILAQIKAASGTWRRGELWWQTLLGVVFAVTTVWLTARGARNFVAGTQMGFAYAFAAVVAGAAAGLVAGRTWPQSARVLLALAGCIVAFVMQIAWPFVASSALAACFFGGVGLGALLIESRSSAASAPQGIELILGILLGIYLFQFGLLLAGFKLLALGIVLTIALRGMWLRQAPIALRRFAGNVSAAPRPLSTRAD
jgi:hypothetical protein